MSYRTYKLKDYRRKKKFNNVSQTYNGITYHSKAEAKMAQDLDWRIKAKEIKGWKRQVKVSLDVNGFHIANYYVDFVIEHHDGRLEYLEVKGFATEVYRLKRLLFEATVLHGNPDIEFTEVRV